MNLALVGCGLIGGSFALALRAAGVVERVVLYDRDADVAARALALGIGDAVAASLADVAVAADVVVLAVPVRAIAACAKEIAPHLETHAILTDVGSTKAGVVRDCSAVWPRFVGGHPLAGRELAGPDAADASLFRGRKALLTPTPVTDRDALATIAGLWRAAGADVIEMDAATHDRLMAAVSHLPHVAAYSLAGALGDVGDGGREFIGMTAGGFTDTTRIASTPPRMWVDVFLENADAIVPLIDALGARLAALRAAMVAGDGAAIERILGEARAARERILGG